LNSGQWCKIFYVRGKYDYPSQPIINFAIFVLKETIMEKKCLIFMPLGDPIGYPAGHFNRIFDYIIAPACRLADFVPYRVDERQETLKSIVNTDMVLCDLSSEMADDIRYNFAVRHGLHLPITLMKDLKTSVDFSMREFSMVEYDESLRIDMVQRATDALGDALKANYANREEIDLLKKLNIGPGQAVDYTGSFVRDSFSSSTVETEKAPEPQSVSVPFIPLPDFVGEAITEKDIEKLRAGDTLYHTTYGKGAIVSIKVLAKEKMANIQFDSGAKLLVLGTSGIFRKIIA
jgi:hypothetical protein